MCDRYSGIFYLIPTKNSLKTQLNLKIPLFLHWFSPNKKASALNLSVSNVITSSQRHKPRRAATRLDIQIRAHLKYIQIKIHVQTARDSEDLKMAFRSFTNGFKQLCVQ